MFGCNLLHPVSCQGSSKGSFKRGLGGRVGLDRSWDLTQGALSPCSACHPTPNSAPCSPRILPHNSLASWASVLSLCLCDKSGVQPGQRREPLPLPFGPHPRHREESTLTQVATGPQTLSVLGGQRSLELIYSWGSGAGLHSKLTGRRAGLRTPMAGSKPMIMATALCLLALILQLLVPCATAEQGE